MFSNRGAKIVHWILKEYRTDAGEPLDLVPGGAGADAIKPFTLTVDDQAISARLNDAIYRVTVNGSAAGEIGGRHRVAADDRLRSSGRRRLQRQEDVHARADQLHRDRSAPSVRIGRAAAESRRSTGAPASATTSRARRRRRSSRRATTRRRSRSFTRTATSSASPPTDRGVAGRHVPLRRRRRSLLRRRCC